MHDKGKSIRVEEGLRLFQQQPSPYWWAASLPTEVNRINTRGIPQVYALSSV